MLGWIGIDQENVGLDWFRKAVSFVLNENANNT